MHSEAGDADGPGAGGQDGSGQPTHGPPQRHRYHDGTPIGMFCRRLRIDEGRPVAVVVGSAEQISASDADVIDHALRKAVVPILDEYEAVVIDGGTNAGVMRLLGMAVADGAPRATLVGVAPWAMVPERDPTDRQALADEHHDHVILTDGDDWSTELPVLGDVAQHLAGAGSPTMVVIGGGDGTRKEIAVAQRLGWPILAIAGSGGAADALAHSSATSDRVRAVEIHDHTQLRKQVRWRLDHNDLLKRMWLAAEALDGNAVASRPRFGGFRSVILALGLGIVVLAITLGLYGDDFAETLHDSLVVVLTILPAAAAALVAWVGRRRRDDRWIAPRAATNSALHEIYRFRARCEKYADRCSSSPATTSAEQVLAASWAAINRQLGRSGAAPISPPDIPVFAPDLDRYFAAPSNELLGRIGGCEYLQSRIRHQLDYFVGRVAKDERITSIAVGLVYSAAIAGTLLASIPRTVAWVAATASAATAVAAWLEYEKSEQRARQYQDTVALVEAGVARWLGRPRSRRHDAEDVAGFVAECESALEGESREWSRAVNEAARSLANISV